MDDQPAGLGAPLTVLRGVGPALAETLGKLGLQQVEDLLFLLPNRYEDRTKLAKIGELRPGGRHLTSGEVLLAETVYRGRRSLLVRIGDGTGQLTLAVLLTFRVASRKRGSRKAQDRKLLSANCGMGPGWTRK